MTEKETAWLAYREAWNTVSSMDTMTELDERTARRKFEQWWSRNHEGKTEDTTYTVDI